MSVKGSSKPAQVPQKDRQPPARAGRPLDATRHAAILAAALDGLAEVGYDRLTMHDIAARARAGKGALYRRWPSKAALVVDAVIAWRDKFAPTAIPDTGSLRGDFEAIVNALPDFDAPTRRRMAVFAGLATAAGRDPELRDQLAATVLERPRQLIGTVLERAVARGEIPLERDLELVPDILIGLNMVQTVLGAGIDRHYIRRVLMTVLYPLVTAAARESGEKPG